MKDKVVFYLEEHQIEERVREHKVRISRTKSEDVFHPLKNKDSLTYKFLETVAKDKVLRQLFFLNFDVNFSYDQLYPVELTFPIFLTSQDDFIKKTENDMFKEKMNFIMSEVERTQEELENLSHSTFVDFISSMMADPAFLKIFKSRKIHGMEETIREILEKHKDRFEEVVAKSLDIFGKTMYVAELTRLNNALEKMVLAQANFEILSQAIKMPDEAEYFFDSLTKLPKHDVSMLSLTSICLECKLRYDKNTYYFSEKNVSRSVNLKIECPNCGGSAVLHYISIGGGGGLKRLVVTRRFQEAIIALTLSELDQIRKIYVGKKVSAVVDGETQRGLEIDIAALTEDNELLVFEVSTTSRESNVVERATKKLDYFSEYYLPFSKFVYLAPTLFEEYLTIGRRGGFIFSAKHIPNLPEYIRETCFD